MNIIETLALTTSYGKARGIIDVNLNVAEGEIFGFIGPNGSGKSTTIRTLLAFIYPNSGSAQIFGKNCFTQSAEIKREIGYLPSEVNYYDDMKAGDLLAYSAKFYKKDCNVRLHYLRDLFEIDFNKRIDSLSLGNKKKVAIAQALLHEPKLLILDEPTGGLDPLMQNNFYALLKEENKRGTTIFFSSHILSEVEKLCDRVGIIKDGKLLTIQSFEHLRDNKFKKIKVEFKDKENMKAFNLDLAGIKDLKTENKHAEFLFNGKIQDVIQRLAQEDVSNLLIEEPSLEEIFIHYYDKKD